MVIEKPLEYRIVASWSMGFMWPWNGYTTSTNRWPSFLASCFSIDDHFVACGKLRQSFCFCLQVVMVYILRTKKFSRVKFWLLFIYVFPMYHSRQLNTLYILIFLPKAWREGIEYFLRICMHSCQLHTLDILLFLPKAWREGIEERVLTVSHIWLNGFHILSCHGVKCESLMWRCGHSMNFHIVHLEV